ncbi:MAG: phosphohistidine phosphatase SixA [Thermoleophilia bacterium]
MRVYFLRHGKSAARETWKGDDAQRPLTEEGMELMRRQAATMNRLGIQPDLIVTSPLTRARQTAEIVAVALRKSSALEESECLARDFDSACLVKLMDAHPDAKCMMVVGHEPDFSQTVSKLLGGGRIQLKKGGLATVDIVERVGDMVFGVLVSLLTPGQMRGA